MSVDDDSDVEFLKDQVQRLSTSLSRYQKKYKEEVPCDNGQSLSQDYATPWIISKRLLTPLIKEYDSTIDELNKHVFTYKTELDTMTLKVEQVTNENAHLHSELRKSLESQIQSATQTKSSTSTGRGGVVDSLRQQLEVVSKEREIFRDRLKSTSQELDIIQKNDQEKARKLLTCKAELIEAQNAVAITLEPVKELQLMCTKLTEERTRCLKAMKTQEHELLASQDQFSHIKEELNAVAGKNEELRQSLEENVYQLKKRESERTRARDTEYSMDDRIHILQMTNVDLEGKYHAAQREASVLGREKAELEEAFPMLQAKISAMEQREVEITAHVKESILVAEAAMLEKDQVVMREQQLAKEVEKLQMTLDVLAKEVGERTRKEVDHAREEFNANIDKMGVEIQRLEQECGEHLAVFERCQREKKLVEKELEKAYAQRPAEIKQNGQTMHDLQKRLCVAERAKEEALVRVEALDATVKRLEVCLLEEKETIKQMTEEHRRWQRQVEEESQQLREHRMKAMVRADDLQKSLRASEQARETLEARLVKEITTLEQKQAMKEKEMVYRLQSSEDAHQRSIQELQSLLTAQHRLGAKWREESKSLTQNFEKANADLKSELTRYKTRSDDLTKQLKCIKCAKEESSKQAAQLTRSNTDFRHRLKEAESQVSELFSHERHWLQERRELNRHLDKLKLQVSRNTRPSTPFAVLNASMTPKHPTRGGQGSSVLNSVALPPTHHHSLSTDPPPPLPQELKAEWNHTLSELKRSIQQVRHDIKLKSQDVPYHKRARFQADEDNSSDCSTPTLSKGDLSQSTSAVS